MKSTDQGYVNKNQQKNLGRTPQDGSGCNQKFYQLLCLHCGHTHMANGFDIWLKKCPYCQKGQPSGITPPPNTASIHKSTPSEQMQAEECIFSTVEHILGTRLERNHKIFLSDNDVYIQPDFFSETAHIVGEIFAHIGTPKKRKTTKSQTIF